MRAKLKILVPVALALAIVAGVIAYHNKVSAPRTSEVEPIPATGNVQDTADLLLQGAAAEDSIMSEADEDAEILDQDSSDTADISEAYGENDF